MSIIKNILLISTEFPPGPGGIGNHAWNIARQLDKQFSIDVLTISDYVTNKKCLEFDKKERFYIHRFERYGLPTLTYLIRTFQIIKHLTRQEYSHCIVSGHFSLLMSTVIKSIKKNIKLVGIFHGDELLQTNFIMKILLHYSLKKLDIMIPVSRYTDSFLPEKFANYRKKFIIPNGVNHEQFNNSNKINSAMKLKGRPCLLTVGSVTNRKGQINLINALPELIKEYPLIHYHCVGLSLEGDWLKAKAVELNVINYVTIHGFIPNHELSNIFKQADVLIMLSQSNMKLCAEGFGIAILEANVFGVPALGSKNTGIEDAIVHNNTGIMIDPYSIDEIVEGIKDIIANRAILSNNAIDWAHEHNWDKISLKYIEAISCA
jgi:phosphatidylinositol alpha-1,6-mannosyltransferase